MLESLKDDFNAAVDLGVVLTIGIVFAGLMVMAYIIWAIMGTLVPDGAWANASNSGVFRGNTITENNSHNATYNSLLNVTSGFDDAVGLLIVAITIFILSIAITALLMLRAR
jgi:hypothetical protein